MARYLGDLSSEAQEVRACIDALDESGLRPFNYDYYYLNLLSVFGRERGLDEARRLAIAAAKSRLWSIWQHQSDAWDLQQRTNVGKALPVRLHGWRKEMLDSILREGKGLVLCTGHYGAFRYILDDLMAFNFHVALAVDTDSALGLRNRFKSMKAASWGGDRGEDPIPIGKGTVRVINVEGNHLATLTLLKTLRNNGITLFYSDGNCGIDGHWGASNKSTIQFLGYPIRVKSGVPRLAASAGSPILPVFSARSDNAPGQDAEAPRGQVFCGRVIPWDSSGGANNESYTLQCLKSIFGQMEHFIRGNPEQWEGACLLHRWRVRSEKRPDGSDTEIPDFDLTGHVEDRACFRLRQDGVACLPTQQGSILVNVDTLQVLKIAAEREWLLSDLGGPGVSRDSLRQRSNGADGYEDAMRFLAALARKGFIQQC